MELRMTPYAVPEALSFNYEELKTALHAKAAQYEAIVYTDDQVKKAKEDRANLNRLKKALNDERIRQEREYMQPFQTFKGQINEIISIIDKPVQAIDRQIKAFDEQRRAERQEAIFAYWKGTGAPEWLHTCKPQWLNASYAMKNIIAEIDANIAQAEKDLAVIADLPAYAFEAMEYYKHTQSLAEAVSEAHRLSEMAARKAAHEAQQAQKQAAVVEEAPATVSKPETVQPTEPAREWIAFQALLSPDEARALGQYMKQTGIQYKAV